MRTWRGYGPIRFLFVYGLSNTYMEGVWTDSIPVRLRGFGDCTFFLFPGEGFPVLGTGANFLGVWRKYSAAFQVCVSWADSRKLCRFRGFASVGQTLCSLQETVAHISQSSGLDWRWSMDCFSLRIIFPTPNPQVWRI